MAQSGGLGPGFPCFPSEALLREGSVRPPCCVFIEVQVAREGHSYTLWLPSSSEESPLILPPTFHTHSHVSDRPAGNLVIAGTQELPLA